MPKPIADMIYRLTRIHEGDFAEDLPIEDRQLMLQDIKDLISAYQSCCDSNLGEGEPI